MNDLKLGINFDLQYRGNRIPLSFLKLRKFFKKKLSLKNQFQGIKTANEKDSGIPRLPIRVILLLKCVKVIHLIFILLSS